MMEEIEKLIIDWLKSDSENTTLLASKIYDSFNIKIEKLENYVNETVGLYAADKSIEELLNLFFDSEDDECRLLYHTQEEQFIEKFSKFINDNKLIFKIKFNY